MSLDAMKQALQTLEGWANHGDWVWPESALEQAKRNTTESITALRAAIKEAQGLADKVPARGALLEQTLGKVWDEMPHPDYQKEMEQEPVAWYFVRDLEKGISFAPDSDSTKSWQPLYTAPLMATEPVAWMHPSWIDPDTRGWASDSFNAIPIEGWVPVFTAPRQWQGLTDDEKRSLVEWAHPDIIDAIELKLRERNGG